MDKTCHASQRCDRCETLPEKPSCQGKLYLWFPVSHILQKVLWILKALKFQFSVLNDAQGLVFDLEADRMDEFWNQLSVKLTAKELSDTQALWMEGEAEPQLHHFSQVTSLRKYMGLYQSEWLLELLGSDRLVSHFQPIVEAANPHRIYAQEALLRGLNADGSLISPARIFSQATEAGLLYQLDVLARQCAIRAASHHQLQELIFINFSPTAVYDPATCLRMTVRAIAQVGIPHHQVVFEVMESDQPPDVKHLMNILRFYQDAGFQVALDDFGAGFSNLNLIHQLRPDFIKLDRVLIQNVHTDPYKAIITEKLLEIAQNLEIKTVAEGVETPEELEWVQKRGATLVQGYLIAKPAATPLKSIAAPISCSA